jgi:hypothetical protein
MKQIWNWIKNNPNRAMFLVPILLVAGISISHVVTWYDMANPINWAIYLSIAIEVGAITALVATSNRIKGGIWFMFGIVTFIQMVGNIFYSYKEIDANGDLFKSWVELTGPIWELMGTELTDVVGMKRWLAFLEGGLLPIISLTSLHFFVKYEKPEEKTPLSKEADRVWEKVKELKKEGKFTEPTEEEIKDEPTALSNSKYRNEIEEEWDGDHALDMVMNDMINSLSEEEISELFDEQPDNTKLEENSSDTIEPIVDSQVELEKQMNEEVSKTVEKVDNELIENALKKYKESRGESMKKVTPKELKERIEIKTTVNQPMKTGKTNIKRID